MPDFICSEDVEVEEIVAGLNAGTIKFHKKDALGRRWYVKRTLPAIHGESPAEIFGADDERPIEIASLQPDATPAEIDEFIRAEARGEIEQIGEQPDGVLLFKRFVEPEGFATDDDVEEFEDDNAE